MGVSSTHDEVGRARGEMDVEFGRGPAEGDAGVASGEGVFEGEEAAAGRGAEEGDCLGHFV